MTARHLLRMGIAIGALAAVAPAAAHPASAPDPAHERAERPVVYRSQPVVQSVSGPHAGEHHADAYEYEYAVDDAPPSERHHAAPHVMHHGAPIAHAYPGSPYPAHTGWTPPPQWDREAWLDECRDRIRGTSRRERGGIIGGLLGAIGGGIAGNRIADGERLAGTLIGAGVGGLAGLAIGTAIGAASDRDRFDECELYLDRYLSGHGPAYGYPGYGYAYPAYTMTYVPVMVAVPQRAVVREYVTTEWVDVPQTTRTVTETRIIRQPAPTKRIRTKTIKRTK